MMVLLNNCLNGNAIYPYESIMAILSTKYDFSYHYGNASYLYGSSQQNGSVIY